jgi:hypothetical protein
MLMLPFIWSHMPTEWPGLQTMIGFLFTIIMSSIVAMLCYFWLIRCLAVSTVSLSNVMTPIIALVLGATLNHEHISAHAVAGIAVVMLGIVMFSGKTGSVSISPNGDSTGSHAFPAVLAFAKNNKNIKQNIPQFWILCILHRHLLSCVMKT